MKDIAGVILAAGEGSRMGRLGDEYPKCLLPILGKALIRHHIERMRDLGIRDITILIGHRGYRIANELGYGEGLGVHIRYVEQQERLGIAHAVGQLEPHVDKPFLLFLGDIFFLTRGMKDMLAAFREGKYGAILATKEEKDVEAIKRNFSVVEDPVTGLVKKVIEKPMYVTTSVKGCGLYLFDLHIFDAIRRTPRTAMRDEYEITDSIQILIDYGLAVRSMPIVEDDMNLTTPEDVLHVNMRLLAATGKDVLIGRDAAVHKGAKLKQVVVGPNAKIVAPVRLSNAVVFPGAVLDAKGTLDHVLVTPSHIHACAAEG